MAYLDHITLCNAYDIGKFRPLMVGDSRIGWVRYDIARHLVAFPEAFRVRGDAIGLHPGLETPAARSAAVDEVARALASEIGTPALRGERYSVASRWGGSPLMTVDRGVVSVFGVPAYGVHVNGIVRRADGLHLWIGRRAQDRPVAPGQLDNMVAGGQPAELGLMDNLVKEAAEEAAVPEALARTARPVGAIRYCLEDQWGLKPDLMFCYDLDLPEDFTPRNTDGEISGFQLLPVAEVAARVKAGGEFKFNVNLVILDFLVRHGLLSPDHEPDYVEIVMGLRRGW
jgi:hypothetical protein